MFRALLAHLQEALHKQHLIYGVCVMSVGCYQDWSAIHILEIGFESRPSNFRVSTLASCEHSSEPTGKSICNL
jgi:hypothetical protein